MEPLPQLIDEFENGAVELQVYQTQGPLRNIYRIKSGVVYLDLPEDQFYNLVDIMVAYKVENYVLPKDPWFRNLLKKCHITKKSKPITTEDFENYKTAMRKDDEYPHG